MAEEERLAGYVEVEDRIARFRRARCVWSGRELEIRAEGPQARLVLSGLFGAAAGSADLAGRAWQPGEEDLYARADALAESELVVAGRGFVIVPESLRVECRRYDERSGSLSVSFEARVASDYEGGAEYDASGSVVAEVVPETEFYPA